MSGLPLPSQAFAFGLIIIASLCVCWRKSNLRVLPPGPAGYPIIGSIFSMPTSEEWLYWSKLGERYGKFIQ